MLGIPLPMLPQNILILVYYQPKHKQDISMNSITFINNLNYMSVCGNTQVYAPK